MKITTGILGCALVAGLMTFASGKAQAKDLVISNEVYAPFNLKLSTEYVSGGKLKKASITSKQFLKDNNYNDKVTLAVNTTTFEVWVINKDSLISNLTSNDTLSIAFSAVQTAQPNANKDSFKEAGIFEVFSDNGPDTFDISGVYSDSFSYGKVDKNNEQSYKESLKAKNLSGSGSIPALDPVNDVPVSGSADYKASAKIVPAL